MGDEDGEGEVRLVSKSRKLLIGFASRSTSPSEFHEALTFALIQISLTSPHGKQIKIFLPDITLKFIPTNHKSQESIILASCKKKRLVFLLQAGQLYSIDSSDLAKKMFCS